MIQFHWYKFSELTPQQLYEVLALRADIFVVEQHCAYLDPDGKDPYAIHLLGTEASDLVAYMRLFPPSDLNNYLVFGRVVSARNARGQGFGKQLVQELMTYCQKHYPNITIQCSAQYYLKKFYESFGLVAYGEIYEEDGIPHIAMKKISSSS